MIKHHIAVCLMATAMVAAPAFAQTDAQPATPPAAGDTMRPSATEPTPSPGAQGLTGPAQTEMATEDAPGDDLRLEGGFIAQQSPNHQLATDLMGLDVVGPDDARIGSVKDLVMDDQNRLVGVVVGVGGFLGIGEKSVGIPVDDLNFVPDVETTAAVGAGTPEARQIDEIRVSMTREQLDEAPVFTRLEAPAPADTTPEAAPTAPDASQPPARPN